MIKKKNRSKKRARAMLSAYSIIMILIVLLGILSHVLPKAKYMAASLESDAASVGVGPGEWEDEMPTGGPAELEDKASAKLEEISLPEGKIFEPAVGDEATGENIPEAKTEQENGFEGDVVETETVGEETADGTAEVDASEEATIAPASTDTTPGTFDSLAECE